MSWDEAGDGLGSWAGLPPVPIRVLVKGASSTVYVSPPGRTRTEQTYAWWLEVMLRAAGMPAEVRNAGAEGARVSRALCHWDTEVQQWSPDVVILNYCQYEAMPGWLPRRLERHATGWHQHHGRLREAYRTRLLNPAWMRLARVQRVVDRRVRRSGPFRTSPERTVAELLHLIGRIRSVGGPLVLVMETWPIGAKWQRWFPRMEERARRMRDLLDLAVEEMDEPDVRIFPLWEMVGRLDPERVLPDGVHYSAALHRRIAEQMAALILEWSVHQPHLGHPLRASSALNPL